MEITEKYGLVIPDENDYYDVSVFNANFKSLEKSVDGSGIDSIVKITKEEYDALEIKDSKTIYVVCSSKEILMYLGDTLLSGGKSENVGNASFFSESVPVGAANDVGFTPLSTIYATERYKMQYWQETTDAKNSCSLTVEPMAPCLLVVAVMHRSKSSDGSVTLNSDGWNHVITSAGIDSTNRNQRIDIFTKYVDTGSYDITTNPPNNGGIASMKAFALLDADSVSVVDNYWAHTVPINPTPTTGKRRLYLLTSTYASTSSNPPMAVELHSSNTKTNMLAIEELRFSAFYDYELDGKTPAFTYCESYSDNMSILTLDINDTEDV